MAIAFLLQNQVDLTRNSPQLRPVSGRKFFENAFADARQLKINLPVILRIARPDDEVFLREPISEAHGAVVPDLEALGQFTHGNKIPTREALDREQCLMLLRGKTRFFGSVFAKAKKLPQRIAELGQHFIIRLCELLFRGHVEGLEWNMERCKEKQKERKT